MYFEEANTNCYTVYSKSGCPNCTKAKDLLKENKLTYNVINCDEYLLEYKQEFLKFIAEIGLQAVATFPIIFFDKKLVGGYKELQQHIKDKDFSLNEDF